MDDRPQPSNGAEASTETQIRVDSHLAVCVETTARTRAMASALKFLLEKLSDLTTEQLAGFVSIPHIQSFAAVSGSIPDDGRA